MYVCWDASTHTKIYESNENKNKNNRRLNYQIIIILGSWNILSLLSGSGTHILDLHEFY